MRINTYEYNRKIYANVHNKLTAGNELGLEVGASVVMQREAQNGPW